MRKRNGQEIHVPADSTITLNGTTYYTNGGVTLFLGRSEASLHGYRMEYKRRTGWDIPRIRDGKKKYMSEDNLFRFILALEDILPFQAEKVRTIIKEREEKEERVTAQ